jgi:hypothetical protein
MTWFKTRRPSAALIVAAIALLVSLGGNAYGSGLFAPGSVGTKDLRNGAVNSQKLKNGSVRTSKLHNGAITARKLSRHLVVPKARFASAAAAAFNSGHASTADQATHAAAASSADGLTGVNYVRSALTESPNNSLIFGEADCPAGQLPVGGGVWSSSTTLGKQSVNSSWPTRQNTTDPAPDAWGAWVNNVSGGTQSFYVYAICVAGSASGSFANDFARRP